MNFLNPILMFAAEIIAKMIARRLGIQRAMATGAIPASTQKLSAEAEAESFKSEIRELAEQIRRYAPQLDLGCLTKQLPLLLRDVADLFTSGTPGDQKQIVSLVLTHITAIIKCQVGIQAGTQATIDTQALNNAILQCAIAAGVTYFQSKDPTKAISQFVTCMLGAAGVGGGGGTSPPPSVPGGQGFVLDPCPRC